jgi:hypothetical protein
MDQDVSAADRLYRAGEGFNRKTRFSNSRSAPGARVPAVGFSIARISHPELANHSPQAIRFTALDHLERCRTLESRVRNIEPRTNL